MALTMGTPVFLATTWYLDWKPRPATDRQSHSLVLHDFAQAEHPLPLPRNVDDQQRSAKQNTLQQGLSKPEHTAWGSTPWVQKNLNSARSACG
ncbi:hypothetical protein GE21DRAFT_1308371 [Neurospora crassa]|nr:hypothetical protein GE21DRAFT_1308371 [Neurospora crassa]